MSFLICYIKPMASVSYNFIQKIVSLKNKKLSSENEEVSSQTNKSESILMEIQKILAWDDPLRTCVCIIAVNILFWTIIYLDFKFYGLIFTIFLILTCEQLWMELFSKYFNKNISSSRNLNTNASRVSSDSSFEINKLFKKGLMALKEIYVKASFLRQSNPGMFCILTCLGFFLIGIFGKSLSGVIALYVFLMLVMTVPGVLIRIVPPYIISGVADLFYSSRKESSTLNDDEVEPYLPDTSEEALELLRLAGDVQPLNKENDEESNDFFLERLSECTSDTAESACSKMSLFPESVLMPSPENSMDFSEFDLLSSERTELNTMGSNGINFQSKHFDGDSSEEEFFKGLDSMDETAKKFKKNEIEQSDLMVTAENLRSLNQKKFSAQQKEKNSLSDKESSDTDSFELILEEEV